MAALKAIKTKIRSIDKTRQVTKAMEAVSASKMRKAQLRALAGRAYARAAAGVLARVSGTQALAKHPLLETRPVAKCLYIVITSDKGLAGGLNSGVLRAVAAEIALQGLKPQDIEVIAVGRKAQDFFVTRGITITSFYPNTDLVTSDTVAAIVAEAARLFADKKVDVVRVAYQNFISTFEQRPTLRQVFPLSLEELQKVVADITPARGAYSSSVQESAQPTAYEVEPSESAILDTILPMLAGIFIYHALMESLASEHSARMVAMKSASDKASDLKKMLTLQFNKARQAAITREVSEITGGMEAMAV
jgi:F-type H+-transporting ATPase subunit gamma